MLETEIQTKKVTEGQKEREMKNDQRLTKRPRKNQKERDSVRVEEEMEEASVTEPSPPPSSPCCRSLGNASKVNATVAPLGPGGP
jgi:hypothetical protein